MTISHEEENEHIKNDEFKAFYLWEMGGDYQRLQQWKAGVVAIYNLSYHTQHLCTHIMSN